MADHYEEGARYIVREDMPRWSGCFVHQDSTEILSRAVSSYTRLAPLWIGNIETDVQAVIP